MTVTCEACSGSDEREVKKLLPLVGGWYTIDLNHTLRKIKRKKEKKECRFFGSEIYSARVCGHEQGINNNDSDPFWSLEVDPRRIF